MPSLVSFFMQTLKCWPGSLLAVVLAPAQVKGAVPLALLPARGRLAPFPAAFCAVRCDASQCSAWSLTALLTLGAPA